MTTATEGNVNAPPCSICGSAPNLETGRCQCPRPSDNRSPQEQLSSQTLVRQAESLFENYLAARLVRARRTLTTAKVALLRDPRNHTKREALRTAELETRKLHAQLLDQARKTAQTREHGAGSISEAPAASNQATEDFRLAQAARAEAVYRAGGVADSLPRSRPDDRDCPSCGEQLPGDTITCSCGYEFAAGQSPIAEPFLTEEEVAILRGRAWKHRE